MKNFRLSLSDDGIDVVRVAGTPEEVEAAARAWRKRTRKRVDVNLRTNPDAPAVADLMRSGGLCIYRSWGTCRATVTAAQLAANEMPVAFVKSADGRDRWQVRYHADVDLVMIGCKCLRLDGAVRALAKLDASGNARRVLCRTAIMGRQDDESSISQRGPVVGFVFGKARRPAYEVKLSDVPVIRRVVEMALEVREASKRTKSGTTRRRAG